MAVLIAQREARKPSRGPAGRLRAPGAGRGRACRVGLWLSLLAVAVSAAAQNQLSEHQLKAAFVYNFAKFVEWPAGAFGNPADPLRFCVLGDDVLAQELEELARSKTIAGRPVMARRVKTLADTQHCHVLFVGAQEKSRVPELPASVRSATMLTIGESDGFVNWGGVINLLLDKDQLRFEVNLQAAEQARLKISSKLLALARAVHTGGGN